MGFNFNGDLTDVGPSGLQAVGNTTFWPSDTVFEESDRAVVGAA